MKTLVIGYGNSLREDDGLGPAAAYALAAASLPEDVEVKVCHQLTPELACELAGVKRAVFIDVCEPGANPPGTILQRDLVANGARPAGVTHFFDPQTLLAMAASFYGQAPEATLFSVAAGSFGMVEGLTPPVQAALPELLQKITTWIYVCS